MSGIYLIEDALDYIARVLRANRELDEIRLFIKGSASLPVSIAKHPYIEIELLAESPISEQTGEVTEQVYSGSVTVYTSLGNLASTDWMREIADRTAEVPSQIKAGRLLSAVIYELSKLAHRSMGDLKVTYKGVPEVVQLFDLTGPREYGLDDRTDSFANYASVPIIVQTVRGLLSPT